MAAQTQTSLVVLLLKLLQMRSLFAFFSGFLLLIFQLLIICLFFILICKGIGPRQNI